MDSATALANLQSFQGSEKAPQDILTGQENTLGVPQAQQQVSGLRQAITNTTNLLNQVAPSVYGRTANSLVTTAQAGRQIQNESAPIQTKLSGLNTAEGNASSDLNTNLSRAQALASLEQSGQQTKEANLMDIYKAIYGQEQDAKSAALEQAKLDEQKREANLSASSRSSGGGLSASQSLSESKAQQQTSTANKIQSNLDKVVGKDGYVSPQSYAAASKDWTQAGYSIKDFNNYFAQYKNPQNPYYAI